MALCEAWRAAHNEARSQDNAWRLNPFQEPQKKTRPTGRVCLKRVVGLAFQLKLDQFNRQRNLAAGANHGI